MPGLENKGYLHDDLSCAVFEIVITSIAHCLHTQMTDLIRAVVITSPIAYMVTNISLPLWHFGNM